MEYPANIQISLGIALGISPFTKESWQISQFFNGAVTEQSTFICSDFSPKFTNSIKGLLPLLLESAF